ncbi:hypothetical protein BsWGS_19834 [Bradybaena similaris]
MGPLQISTDRMDTVMGPQQISTLRVDTVMGPLQISTLRVDTVLGSLQIQVSVLAIITLPWPHTPRVDTVMEPPQILDEVKYMADIPFQYFCVTSGDLLVGIWWNVQLQVDL